MSRIVDVDSANGRILVSREEWLDKYSPEEAEGVARSMRSLADRHTERRGYYLKFANKIEAEIEKVKE